MNKLYFCRIPTEKVERSPLKRLQSANCSGPAITTKAPANHKLNHTISEGHLSCNGKEPSLRKMNGSVQGKERPIVNGKQVNDKVEQGQTPTGCGSKFSCQWNEATTQEGRVHYVCVSEQSEEDKWRERGGDKPKDESTEQKLYKIANELLQTERAYVARLHLLDQVSGDP